MNNCSMCLIKTDGSVSEKVKTKKPGHDVLFGKNKVLFCQLTRVSNEFLCKNDCIAASMWLSSPILSISVSIFRGITFSKIEDSIIIKYCACTSHLLIGLYRCKTSCKVIESALFSFSVWTSQPNVFENLVKPRSRELCAEHSVFSRTLTIYIYLFFTLSYCRLHGFKSKRIYREISLYVRCSVW